MRIEIALGVLTAFVVSMAFLSGCVTPPTKTASELKQEILAQAPQGTGSSASDVTGEEISSFDTELADLQDLLQETEEINLEGTGITDDFLK